MNLRKFKSKIRTNLRKLLITRKWKRELKSHEFSIISSDCFAGIFLNEINRQFNTPTVNLYFDRKDFIKYVNDIKGYSKKKLVFISSDFSYPVALLDDIKIYFMHFQSNAEAEKSWIRRTKRINYDKIFVVMSDTSNTTEKDILDFESLEYPKVILSNKISDKDYVHYIGECKSNVLDYINTYSIKRWFDSFDWISWIKKGK